MSAAFDALRLARNLRDKAQLSPERPEGMVEAMQGDLAAKSDLREVELRLGAEIEATTSDLIAGVVGMTGFQTLVPLGAAPTPAGAFVK